MPSLLTSPFAFRCATHIHLAEVLRLLLSPHSLHSLSPLHLPFLSSLPSSLSLFIFFSSLFALFFPLLFPHFPRPSLIPSLLPSSSFSFHSPLSSMAMPRLLHT